MANARQDEKATASSPRHDAEAALNATTTDQDLAINLVGERAQDIDSEVEAKVLRKIDWFLIPAMIVGTSMLPTSSIPSISHHHDYHMIPI